MHEKRVCKCVEPIKPIRQDFDLEITRFPK